MPQFPLSSKAFSSKTGNCFVYIPLKTNKQTTNKAQVACLQVSTTKCITHTPHPCKYGEGSSCVRSPFQMPTAMRIECSCGVGNNCNRNFVSTPLPHTHTNTQTCLHNFKVLQPATCNYGNNVEICQLRWLESHAVSQSVSQLVSCAAIVALLQQFQVRTKALENFLIMDMWQMHTYVCAYVCVYVFMCWKFWKLSDALSDRLYFVACVAILTCHILSIIPSRICRCVWRISSSVYICKHY